VDALTYRDMLTELPQAWIEGLGEEDLICR